MDYVEFYLRHVLTKFLIVGRALCTKNQSHVYYLDCVKSISVPCLEYYLDCAGTTNQSHELYLEHLLNSALRSTPNEASLIDKSFLLQKEDNNQGLLPDLDESGLGW